MKLLPSLYKRALAMRVPATSTIELLAPCNLKCVHCYVTHSKRNALTLPVLDDLFAQMADAGCFAVTLTGGEVGLRKDLFDIIAAARSRQLLVTLLSSGTMWTEEHWDRLAELGVAEVRFSVYALDACVHDAVTLVPGSLEKTLASLHGLRARGVAVAIATPVMSLNAAAVPEVVKLANELDLPMAIDSQITVTDEKNLAPKDTVASREQLIALYRDPTVYERFKGPEPSCVAPEDDSRSCSVGRYSTFIRCTGDVYPCSNWPTSAGSILSARYIDIYRHSAGFEFARGVRLRDQTGCRDCGDRGVCRQCIGMNLQEHGDVAIPSPTVCTETEARAEAFHGGSARLRGRPSLRIVG